MSVQSPTEHARASAGHTALAVVANYGDEVGAEILRGYVQGFIAAFAAEAGWAEALHVVNTVAAQYLDPEHTAKPRLVIDNQPGRVA